jgi:hypothetical protein
VILHEGIARGEHTSGMALLDHLIRPLQERRRDGQAQGLGGLKIDHEAELRGLLDWQVGRLGALSGFYLHRPQHVAASRPLSMLAIPSYMSRPCPNLAPRAIGTLGVVLLTVNGRCGPPR